jgi:large subunit ribosomal protein L25
MQVPGVSLRNRKLSPSHNRPRARGVVSYAVARQRPRVCVCVPAGQTPRWNADEEVRGGKEMAELILMAEPRTVVGKQVKQLRREGLIPGVVYGPGLGGNATIQVSVNRRDLERAYAAYGSKTLITLQWDGGSKRVYIRELQADPVKRTPIHVDFFVPA